MSDQLQQRAVRTVLATIAAVAALVLFIPGQARSRATQPDWLYGSAFVFTGFWVLGSAQLLWMRSGWRVGSDRMVAATGTMWVGLVCLCWHIVVAYDRLGTHADVLEHTRRTAGVGWGVYVNYLFTAVWLADTVWLTTATRSYACRPQWVGRVIHGFLAFVVFNATVVYGEPATRAAGAVWFAILGFSWWRRANGRQLASRSGPPGLPA